jgi:hypothetical protein
MLQPVSGLRLRRALFGILISAGRPLTVHEVVSALHAAGVTTPEWCRKPPAMVVADMLGYQVRAGRVLRTGRATFTVVPASSSRSTRRRCLHWRDGLS